MVQDRTRNQTRQVDVFKSIVALILVGVVAILLLRGTPVSPVAAPTLDRPPDAATVEAGAIEFAGTGEPGSFVEVLLDGDPIGGTMVGDDGRWSLVTPVTGLGKHDLSVRTVNENGETLASTEPIRLTLIEPQVVVPPTPESEMPTLILPAELPAGGEVTLTGTGTPGIRIEVVVDGEVAGTATVGEDGRWSFLFKFDPGEWELRLRALDAAGQVLAESEPVEVQVPQPVVVEPPTLDPPGEVSASGEITLTGRGAPGTRIEVVVDGEVAGTATAGEDGRWSFPFKFDPGEWELRLRALDAAGQVLAESEPVRVQVPQPVVVEPPTLDPPGEVSASGEITLTGRGTPGTRVEVVVDGEVAGTATVGEDGRWSFPFKFDPGEWELRLHALDAAGQVLAESEPVRVQVPQPVVVEPPTLDPPGEVSASGEITLTGRGTPGIHIEVVANDEVVGMVTVDEDGEWSLTTRLEPGEYELGVRVLDAEGNVLAESEPVPFSQPGEAASPTIESPTDKSLLVKGIIELSGRGAPDTKIEILVNGEVVGATVVSSTGTWTFSRRFPPGRYTLAVQNVGDPGSKSDLTRIRVQICRGLPPHGEDRGDTYVVARCEYMSIIAQRTGVSLQDLIAVNPQVEDPNLIYPGQILNLPPRD